MRRLMLALVLLLAACGGESTPTTEPAAFDLSAVETKFTADCKDNARVGTWFCGPVDLNRMTGEGSILIVPTSIDPDAERARDDGELICGWFAGQHVSADGTNLGYEVVGILDKGGGNLAACGTFGSSDGPALEGTPSSDAPPPGEIWFGDAFETTTFAVEGRRTTATLSEETAVVATFSKIVEQSMRFQVLHVKDVVYQEVIALDDPANTYGFILTMDTLLLPPGSYTFRFRDAGGHTVAQGAVKLTN